VALEAGIVDRAELLARVPALPLDRAARERLAERLGADG